MHIGEDFNSTQPTKMFVSTEQIYEATEEEGAIVFKVPYVYPATGDWILNKFDIECIAVGAGIMGCGGGGSPYLGRLKALEQIRKGREIHVIHPDK